MIAIVGGGPAGLSTALFLHHVAPELARRAVVLEKGRYPREKICAGAIGGRALDLLASIGARPDVPHVAVRGIAVTTRHGRLVERCDETCGWIVRRREFDAGLAAVARARDVVIEEGASVRAIHREADGFRIEMETGATHRARVVVGADGVGSIVRRSLGWTRGKVVAQAVEIDTERSASDLPPDVMHFDLTSNSTRGYAWDFPTPLDGQVRMSRGVYDLGPRVEDPGAALDRRTEGERKVGAKRRFSERGAVVGEVLSRHGVLLVGEAAGIDPVLGEGIAQAIYYGASAAHYLARALGAGRLGFEDYEPLAPRSRHSPRSEPERRLALDLSIRARALDHVYGETRETLERTVARSHAFARAGLDYFAGRRVSRLDLLRAGSHLARARFRWGA